MIYDGGDTHSNFMGASKSGDKYFMLDLISDEISNLLSDSKSRNDAISFLNKNGYSVDSKAYNEDLVPVWIDALSKSDIVMVYTSKSIFNYHEENDEDSKDKLNSKAKTKITDVSKNISEFFADSKNVNSSDLINTTIVKANNKAPQFAKHDADSLTKEERLAKEAKKEKRDLWLMGISTILVIGYYYYKVRNK